MRVLKVCRRCNKLMRRFKGTTYMYNPLGKSSRLDREPHLRDNPPSAMCVDEDAGVFGFRDDPDYERLKPPVKCGFRLEHMAYYKGDDNGQDGKG